jgi:hypothetical protein
MYGGNKKFSGLKLFGEKVEGKRLFGRLKHK